MMTLQGERFWRLFRQTRPHTVPQPFGSEHLSLQTTLQRTYKLKASTNINTRHQLGHATTLYFSLIWVESNKSDRWPIVEQRVTRLTRPRHYWSVVWLVSQLLYALPQFAIGHFYLTWPKLKKSIKLRPARPIVYTSQYGLHCLSRRVHFVFVYS